MPICLRIAKTLFFAGWRDKRVFLFGEIKGRPLLMFLAVWQDKSLFFSWIAGFRTTRCSP